MKTRGGTSRRELRIRILARRMRAAFVQDIERDAHETRDDPVAELLLRLRSAFGQPAVKSEGSLR
jgi:hypothetical protein